MKTSSCLKYLVVITTITILIIAIHVAVQQSNLTGANDQKQVASHITKRLQQGKVIDSLFTDTINITRGVTAVVVFHNKRGENPLMRQPSRQVTAKAIVSSTDFPVCFVASAASNDDVERRDYNLKRTHFEGWGLYALY